VLGCVSLHVMGLGGGCVATSTSVVQVSGRGSSVDFTIDDSAPFKEITKGLRDYLVRNRGLWSQGTIGVNAGRWMLSQEQLGLIKHIIETESGLTVGRFWSPPGRLEALTGDTETTSPKGKDEQGAALIVQEGTNGTSHRVLIHNQLDNSVKPCETRLEDTIEPDTDSLPIPPQINHPKIKSFQAVNSSKGMPTQALFVKTTFRSGQSINYHGDVVVLADVNPGAEIIAEGDIVVLGSLRGMAHAGSGGDTKAVIIALEMDSPRIQIGPHTGLAPSSKSGSKSMLNGPEIAYVKRRSVYVSPYAGRFTRYSRGILYEG